jgi:DNA invertase Pin-like site-specific DNA recombinase
MHVAAYVRVSSQSQKVATQRDAIAQAATVRRDGPLRWYVEHFTGATTKRPELDRLRDDVRRGLISKLYVFRLDRLSRTGIRDTLDLVDEFRRAGCALISIADGFDMDGPAGEIVLAVIAWAAKVERLAIGERISAARSRVEAAGGAWGRPQRMSKAQSTKARELAAKGLSVRSIAVALKVPRSTVYRAVSRKPVTKQAAARARNAAARAR